MSQYVKDLLSIWFVPDQFKTQKMWNKTVQIYPWALKNVPDHYKTQEMCNEAVQSDNEVLECDPDQYKTQEMCNEAVEKKPRVLKFVPDQFVTQEMWHKAVKKKPEILRFIHDQFVNHEYFHDVLITWRDAYIKRKAQRAKIKEELMPIACHPDRWWNWCVPQHEKKELEIYFV